MDYNQRQQSPPTGATTTTTVAAVSSNGYHCHPSVVKTKPFPEGVVVLNGAASFSGEVGKGAGAAQKLLTALNGNGGGETNGNCHNGNGHSRQEVLPATNGHHHQVNNGRRSYNNNHHHQQQQQHLLQDAREALENVMPASNGFNSHCNPVTNNSQRFFNGQHVACNGNNNHSNQTNNQTVVKCKGEDQTKEHSSNGVQSTRRVRTRSESLELQGDAQINGRHQSHQMGGQDCEAEKLEDVS